MIKHSKQRDAIYNFLKERKDHPTADFIYAKLREDHPNLSLGTVYRNLQFLEDQQQIMKVQVGDGSIHYDPNTYAHDHFICSNCGCVLDIETDAAEERERRAAIGFPGKILGSRTYYYGFCEKCLASDVASSR